MLLLSRFFFVSLHMKTEPSSIISLGCGLYIDGFNKYSTTYIKNHFIKS